jgi:hypothetical protein
LVPVGADDEMRADHAGSRADAAFIGAHDGDGHPCVSDHDPLAAAYTSDELAEEVPGVVRVVLRKAVLLVSLA